MSQKENINSEVKFSMVSEQMNLFEDNILKTKTSCEWSTPLKPKNVEKKQPKSDFKYFAANLENINDSVNRSANNSLMISNPLQNTKKSYEFGEFGVFKSPVSKFAPQKLLTNSSPPLPKPWNIENSDDKRTNSIGKNNKDQMENKQSISSSFKSQSGPRILKEKDAKIMEKFENSSVQIFKSEIKSYDNSLSRNNDKKSEFTNQSGESMHLKVKMGQKKKEVTRKRSPSKDSFSSLRGSMLSEIFCLDVKNKKVPISKLSEKMKSKTKFYSMMVKSQESKSSFTKMKNGLVFSDSTFTEIQNVHDQTNATLFFFKALIRLSKIFLEKLQKPKHCLKCLLFLEKNYQVNSSLIIKSQSSQNNKSKTKKYQRSIRLIGSSDSIEDYIRETQNKVHNLYSPGENKTHLLPEQAGKLFFLLGKTYLAMNDHSKAEEKLVWSHVYNKSNFESLYELAEINFQLKNFKKAERFYRKAHFNNQEDNRAILGMAECNLREKNYDFLAELAKSINCDFIKDPKVSLLFCSGILELLSKSNRYPTNHNKELFFLLKKFLKKSEYCLSRYPNTENFQNQIKMRNQVAQNYFKIKEFQAGINCLNKINELSMTPLTLYNLAYAHFKTGNLSHSMGFINQTLVLKGKHKKSLLLKAEISKKKGDLKTAQTILQNLIERNSTDPVINRMLGDVFKFKGSFFQAIEHYEVRDLISDRSFIQRK